MSASSLLDRLACGIVSLFRIVPWRAGVLSGRWLGGLVLLVQRSKRFRTIENLLRAGSPDPVAASRHAGKHAGMTLAEILWLIGRGPSGIGQRLRIEGIDVLERARAAGRGVLLVSAHVGNWELVALAACRAGSPLAVVARPLKTPRLEARTIGFRNRCGIRTLRRGSPGAGMAAARWLRRGGILGCMMDRASQGSRIVTPFLGRATNVPLGPAELACRFGAAVVLGSARREPDGTTTVSFRPLPVGKRDDPVRLAETVSRALEEEIRPRPEQWFWIYRRQPDLPGARAVQTVPADLGDLKAPALHG